MRKTLIFRPFGIDNHACGGYNTFVPLDCKGSACIARKRRTVGLCVVFYAIFRLKETDTAVPLKGDYHHGGRKKGDSHPRGL